MENGAGTSPPPNPWQRAGSSSDPAPFKPQSSGSTSDVVDASGTARPGEIVTTAAANTNAVADSSNPLKDESGTSPPPNPWQRAGSSSGPAPLKPQSSGSTSDVVDASGTARPGEIVTTAAANTNAMADSSNPLKDESVCKFFKKPTKNKNIRKRNLSEDDGVVEEVSRSETTVLFNRKKSLLSDNKLHFSTAPPKHLTSSEKSDVETKKGQTLFQFESSSEVQVQNDSRATATLETETDFSRDARAVRERVLKQAEAALKGKNKSGSDEKLYKGINAYTDHKAGFRREQTVAGEKAGGSHGPLRASAHIRVSARFDYQPDICKDYKETGYCGYGDSCKFMHDRGDYKSGWQLEKEWDEKEKARKRNLALKQLENEEDAEESDEDEDSLPFACFICRQPFVDPVVTKCKHYFCEHCALKHHAKNKKCFVCNTPTLGIFNTAHEIRKRIAAEQKK